MLDQFEFERNEIQRRARLTKWSDAVSVMHKTAIMSSIYTAVIAIWVAIFCGAYWVTA